MSVESWSKDFHEDGLPFGIHAEVTLDFGDVSAEDFARLSKNAHVDVVVHCDDPAIDGLVEDVRLKAVREVQSDGAGLPAKRAVIALDSLSSQAERLFRSAVVSLDSIPGNQVEGISPLYHVSNLDGRDAMTAVVQISTHLAAKDLVTAAQSIQNSLSGEVNLNVVDLEGASVTEEGYSLPWPLARDHASVLAPWLDMDPDAHLGKDAVSYLLASAPDAERVGILYDNWVIEGMQE